MKNYYKDVLMLVCCCLVAAAVDEAKVLEANPFWEQTMDAAMYSSVGVVGHTKDSDVVRFAAASWLNDPKLVEVFSTESENGTVDWMYQPASLKGSPSTIAVSTARHIDLNSSGFVDVVAAAHVQGERGQQSSCVLLGFRSDSDKPEPIWQYNVSGNCSVDLTLEGDSKAALKLSDDGSTVVFAVAVSGLPELHCVDGQTGSPLFVFRPENGKLGMSSVSLSRGGNHIAYGNGNLIYVLEKSSGKLRTTAPLTRQMVSEVHICPMGVFLLYAVNDGSVVRRWNARAGEYQITKFQPKTPDGPPNTWIAVSHATSVNGGGGSPAGCIAAIGWLGMGVNQGIAKLEVFSMITGQVFVNWTSKKGQGLENFPVMAMHLGYTALGTWGNTAKAAAPTLYLFHISEGSNPVMEYVSRGSVMAVDILSNTSTLEGDSQDRDAGEAAVFVVAAGKQEHATMEGRGGQCVALKVPVKDTQKPPAHPPLS
eukprot:g1877.t1